MMIRFKKRFVCQTINFFWLQVYKYMQRVIIYHPRMLYLHAFMTLKIKKICYSCVLRVNEKKYVRMFLLHITRLRVYSVPFFKLIQQCESWRNILIQCRKIIESHGSHSHNYVVGKVWRRENIRTVHGINWFPKWSARVGAFHVAHVNVKEYNIRFIYSSGSRRKSLIIVMTWSPLKIKWRRKFWSR